MECGEDFTAWKSNAKWCSKRCRIRTNGRAASRRRGALQPDSEPYVDREIFERDSWICQICHFPIDESIPRTEADGATIDHVIPLSIGGIDAPSNVVAAHWRCNRMKKDRVRATDLAASVVEFYPDLVREALEYGVED